MLQSLAQQTRSRAVRQAPCSRPAGWPAAADLAEGCCCHPILLRVARRVAAAAREDAIAPGTRKSAFLCRRNVGKVYFYVGKKYHADDEEPFRQCHLTAITLPRASSAKRPSTPPGTSSAGSKRCSWAKLGGVHVPSLWRGCCKERDLRALWAKVEAACAEAPSNWPASSRLP